MMDLEFIRCFGSQNIMHPRPGNRAVVDEAPDLHPSSISPQITPLYPQPLGVSVDCFCCSPNGCFYYRRACARPGVGSVEILGSLQNDSVTSTCAGSLSCPPTSTISCQSCAVVGGPSEALGCGLGCSAASSQ